MFDGFDFRGLAEWAFVGMLLTGLLVLFLGIAAILWVVDHVRIV